MNCKRCGAEIIGEQKFCGNCGEPVPESANTGYGQQTVYQQPNMGEYTDNGQQMPPRQPYTGANNAQQEPPRQPYMGAYADNGQWSQNNAFGEKPRRPKKSKKPLVIVAILAIIAVVAVLAVILVPIIKKAFMSEQERFAMYDRELVEDALEALSESAEKAGYDAEYSGSLGINLSDSVKDQIGAYIGDVSSAKIIFDVASEGQNHGCKIGILLGETEIITLDVIVDIRSGKAYIEAPGLVEGALELDIGQMTSSDFSELSVLIDSLSSIELNRHVINEVLELIDAAYGEANDVVRSKGTLEVDGVLQNCTVYTLEINEVTARRMAIAFLEQLKKSDDIKSFAYEIASKVYTGNELTKGEVISEIDDFADEVIRVINETEPSDGDEVITYKMYVDSDDDVVGRTFSFADQFEIKLVCAENGKDVAFEYSYTTSYEEGFKLVGKGKQDKNGFTGNASLYVQNYELLNLTFDKFKSDDEELFGSVEVTFGDDIGELDIDYDALAILSTLKLNFDFNVTSDKSKIGIGVSAMNFDLGEILLESTTKSTYEPQIPADIVYSDPEEFGSGIDVYELMARLAEAGLDLGDLMGGY